MEVPIAQYLTEFSQASLVGYWALFAFVSACFAGWLAEVKDRNPFAWFVLGLVFAPLGLIAIAGAPALDSSATPASAPVKTTPCSRCGLPIRSHDGAWLHEENGEFDHPAEPEAATPRRW